MGREPGIVHLLKTNYKHLSVFSVTFLHMMQVCLHEGDTVWEVSLSFRRPKDSILYTHVICMISSKGRDL